MGITTSSSSEFDQFLTQVGYGRKEYLRKSFERVMEKELDALFEPKLEESFADRETESAARYYEFMRGGPCKESFMAMDECRKEAGIPSEKCREPLDMFCKCLDSHPDYYHPYLAVMKTFAEHGRKEIQALDAMKQALKDDALAMRNQAFRDNNNKLRGFRTR